MSSAESLLDLQWLCVLTLFMASVVTLLLYFVQYFSRFSPPGSRAETEEDSGEAEELLCWTLGLKSWRSEWRRAWFRALNQSKAEGHVQLTFEEDGVQTSELTVGRISSFSRSAGQKNVQCAMSGEQLQFSLSASRNAAPTETPLRYSVKISPLQLQLALQLREVDGQVQVTWAVEHLDCAHIRLTPSYTQGVCAGLSEAEVMARLRKVLSDTRPSVNLSSRPAQPGEVQEVRSRTPPLTSPPKPPRAHEWKLLVKNIRVTCMEEDAAGSVSPQCVLQLDDPPQKLTSSALADTRTPSWEQPFIFELSGKSKELNIQVLDSKSIPESGLLGQVCVPFDLVKRHPRGQQTFALMNNDQVTGSLTSEFTYLEPSEVRTWQPPTPAPSKRVEMDRTVMPCGTVVTTVTAVKSRPGRPLPPETPSKSKLSERRVSEQPSKLGAKVSKALSSSDTELLMLNGTDPVAEAAIRQLYESAKQKHKSPVKKSTIIISGVTKAPLSQDEEMALMAGYAAAMDASMSGASDNMKNDEEMTLSEPAADPTASDVSDPLEGPSTAGQEDWESQAGEDPDADKTSLSLCMSETGSKKGKEESSDKQTVLLAEQLPAQERQAVLQEEAPEEGAGHEPVPQRPAVPGAAAGRLGSVREGEEDGHFPENHQPQTSAQEQEQSQRDGEGAAFVTRSDRSESADGVSCVPLPLSRGRRVQYGTECCSAEF
ncbi:C2 domain-containing protein 2 isoform X2 [Pygocentrus nattereri]|uniref:C2 domain-containing protein n=1 Tax=Pygocentrus nattereri TaxID=42514 RepID=A0AAR2JX98_PYGNA|nr:C2 domain-containing protein 2 isoform X2 [Pygocentrus nattereri]